MNATPNSVPWGSDLKISWSVAVDEASSGDWVAIYPVGATNDQYVDYRYDAVSYFDTVLSHFPL